MENIMMLVIGLVIIAIGIANTKGHIGTIHSYHRRNVKQEDIPAYGKMVGLSTIIVGIDVILCFFISLSNESILPYILTPPIIISIVIFIKAQYRYNGSIF